MKPVYFDFTVSDVAEARSFFENVFGWEFEKFPMPYSYYRINAGTDDEPGIDGGMGSIADTPTAKGRPLTQVTVPVESVDACVERVVSAGGKVIEGKSAIPGIGWFAACTEPGGLLFGVLESDSDAK